MEKTALMQNIRQSAAKLKDGKLKRSQMLARNLDVVRDALGLASHDEAMVFVAIFDRQCGSSNTDLEDLSNYFEITSLDVMQFVPVINDLMDKGFLTVENRTETLLTRKQFMVCPDVFYAVVEGRKVEPVAEAHVYPYDQFDFCSGVSALKQDRARGLFSTAKLLLSVEKMEQEHADLELVSKLKAQIGDIESRTLFYEMCKDFAERPDNDAESDINATLIDIYDRVLSRTQAKHLLVNGSHPLMQAKLIRQSDKNAVKLTVDGIRLLFGDKADAIITKSKCADRYEFAHEVKAIVEALPYRHNMLQQCEAVETMNQLEDDNDHLSMIENIKGQITDEKERMTFYLVVNEAIDGSTYSMSDLSDFFSRSQAVRVKRSLKDSSHTLVKMGLIEVSGGGIFEDSQLSLTDKGKALYFEEDLQLFESRVESKDLIAPEKIQHKRLFFEPKLQRQLDLLSNSLNEENYQLLRKRLEDNKMPQGVAVLLYGNPGTGKTESVMQLARATGRPIFHVDISATKTCWFGESEKLIKEVFTKYRKLCEKSSVTPILLFNEADAVFSKRKDSNSSSVAQTENAIQNIILEEMERLDGILIATTNLADNLDSAFERRFLMKIRFDRPSVDAKQQIWRDKLPSLTTDESTMLASRYDFSGGEIDNISRKVIMTEVIDGTRPGLDLIVKLCDEEKIGSRVARVGF